MQKSIFTTKTLVLGGLCLALSTVLSYFKLFEMPQGGSVTLASMLPILFFAFISGPVPGLIVGFAYGLLQAALGGYIISLPQFLLDYPLAFTCMGLVAIVPKSIKNLYVRFSLGVMIAMVLRGIMHVLSGLIFFSEGVENPLAYSFVYNFSFMSVEFVITIVIGIILIASPVYSSLKKTVATA